MYNCITVVQHKDLITHKLQAAVSFRWKLKSFLISFKHWPNCRSGMKTLNFLFFYVAFVEQRQNLCIFAANKPDSDCEITCVCERVFAEPLCSITGVWDVNRSVQIKRTCVFSALRKEFVKERRQDERRRMGDWEVGKGKETRGEEMNWEDERKGKKERKGKERREEER